MQTTEVFLKFKDEIDPASADEKTFAQSYANAKSTELLAALVAECALERRKPESQFLLSRFKNP